ncbi:MAG: hypothetical protein GY751_13860 [Bacteroidetes bacterium]|nr:hypothetical protein [Bacteroidota bacterium]
MDDTQFITNLGITYINQTKMYNVRGYGCLDRHHSQIESAIINEALDDPIEVLKKIFEVKYAFELVKKISKSFALTQMHKVYKKDSDDSTVLSLFIPKNPKKSEKEKSSAPYFQIELAEQIRQYKPDHVELFRSARISTTAQQNVYSSQIKNLYGCTSVEFNYEDTRFDLNSRIETSKHELLSERDSKEAKQMFGKNRQLMTIDISDPIIKYHNIGIIGRVVKITHTKLIRHSVIDTYITYRVIDAPLITYEQDEQDYQEQEP